MLDNVRTMFEQSANRIPNWRTCTKLELARGYVENESNEELRDAYFAALALRYWYRIPILYKDSMYIIRNIHLDEDDIGDWFFEALQKVLAMRSFMDSTKMTYVEAGSEDKFLNRCVYTAIDNVRKNWFQYYNYKKRGGNLYNESLDAYEEKMGEMPLENSESKYSKIDKLIRSLLQDTKIFEALVVYTIVYDNCFVIREIDGKEQSVFSSNLLLTRITTLPDDKIEVFLQEYGNDKIDTFDIIKYQLYSLSWKQILLKNAINYLKSRGELQDICF